MKNKNPRIEFVMGKVATPKFYVGEVGDFHMLGCTWVGWSGIKIMIIPIDLNQGHGLLGHLLYVPNHCFIYLKGYLIGGLINLRRRDVNSELSDSIHNTINSLGF
jgi:hypothetical protein